MVSHAVADTSKWTLYKAEMMIVSQKWELGVCTQSLVVAPLLLAGMRAHQRAKPDPNNFIHYCALHLFQVDQTCQKIFSAQEHKSVCRQMPHGAFFTRRLGL